MKRYDMKRILADPTLRRWLITRSVVVTQAREDIYVSQIEAERIYDEHQKERQNHARKMAKNNS